MKFVKVLDVFIWGMIAIISSAGAINSLEDIYVIAGIANLIINGTCIYKFIKNNAD